MEIRPFRDGDEGRVFDLMERVYGQRPNEKGWHWRHNGNPLGRHIHWVAQDGDRIVSQASLGLVKMTVRGQERLAGQAETFVTDANYRRRGLCSELVKNAHAEGISRGMALMYAYPNGESYPLFKKLGYFDIPLRFMVAPLFPWHRGTNENPERGNPFDTDVGPWLGRVAVLKGKDYLRWKYVDNPVAQYVTYRGSWGDERGYVVGRIKRIHGIKVGCIFEIAGSYWSSLGKVIEVAALVMRMKDYFRRNGARVVFYNMAGWPEWYPLLRGCGFHSLGTITARKYRFVACAGAAPVKPSDDWFMQLGDSEDL